MMPHQIVKNCDDMCIGQTDRQTWHINIALCVHGMLMSNNKNDWKITILILLTVAKIVA